MVAQNLVHPEEEGVQVLGVVLEPSCVEVESYRCSVLVVMAIKVMVEEVVELVTGQDVGAGVDHSATWKVLVEVWILSSVQLVQHHLPDSVASGGAVLLVAVAAVGHAEVHGVWPEGWVGKRSSNGGVVEEGLLLHHGELVVATNPQVGGSNTDHRVVSQVGVLLDYDPHASHFLGPVVDGRITPELFIVVVPVDKWEKGYWGG